MRRWRWEEVVEERECGPAGRGARASRTSAGCVAPFDVTVFHLSLRLSIAWLLLY